MRLAAKPANYAELNPYRMPMLRRLEWGPKLIVFHV